MPCYAPKSNTEEHKYIEIFIEDINEQLWNKIHGEFQENIYACFLDKFTNL